MINYINKKVTLLTAILSIFAVFSVSFLFNISAVDASENDNCLFCKTEVDEAKKEKQFADKIKIIKTVFKQKINPAVLAATVMYIDFEDGIEAYYEADFNKKDYNEKWISISKTLNEKDENEEDGWAILEDDREKYNNEKIDLLTAAAIVMVLSSENGMYNEDAYKKALMSNVGFVENNAISNLMCSPIGGFIGLFASTFTNSLKIVNPLNDYTIGDHVKFVTNMGNICNKGFIGATYGSVDTITDEEKKQLRKKKIADEIIEFAEAYKYWFGTDDERACLTGNTQAGDLGSMSREECIAFLGPLAQAEYSRTKIFASVTIAQAILEADCGKYTPKNSNNIFGIKCNGWEGKCVDAVTQEQGSGGMYTITDGFRVYDSVEEGIADHSNFLVENSRYAEHGVFEATTYEEQIKAIHQAGYATASNYSSSVINLIKTHQLDKWDVITNVTNSHNICSPVGLTGWTLRTIKPTSSDSAFNYVSSNRGQCVWYAQGRAIEIVEELGERGKLSSSEVKKIRELLLKPYGNGGDIYDRAKNVFNGSSNIREPKSGSYIVWKEPGNYGHVGIVEEVNTGDNTITITEGWATGGASCPSSWGCVNFLTQTLDLNAFYNSYGKYYTGGYNFSGYIYFLEPKE